MRISSTCTGIVNTRAALGSVPDRGPSCSGVLNLKPKSYASVRERESDEKRETYTPPHLLAAPDNLVPSDKYTHAVAEVRDPDNRVMGTGFWDYAHFWSRDVRARAVEHGKEGGRRSS